MKRLLNALKQIGRFTYTDCDFINGLLNIGDTIDSCISTGSVTYLYNDLLQRQLN